MFPIILESGLDKRYKDKWERQFVANRRTSAEGIWRRTQQEETKLLSDWQPGDARRRMIHFLDAYDLQEDQSGGYDFAITNVYLWLSVTLPQDECKQFHQRVLRALSDGNWQEQLEGKYTFSDLELQVVKSGQHPEDVKAGRLIPADYKTYEYTIMSKDFDITNRLIESPWRILSTGIRKMGVRSANVETTRKVSDILPYLPAQVELGGGASIDVGVPPLNHLHRVYNVTIKKNGHFVFGDDDTLPNLLRDPVAFYQRAGDAYRKCLLAEPNSFYTGLKDMFDRGQAVGEVITNNFDGMTSLVGLKEKYVRRYDEPELYPEIDFHPDARSLLVIGSHADRRQVQKQARERGLKVIFIDPETYYDYDGNRIDYPLENAQASDIILHMTAAEFGLALSKLIKPKRLGRLHALLTTRQ